MDVEDGGAGVNGLLADPIHEMDAEFQAQAMDLISDVLKPFAPSG